MVAEPVTSPRRDFVFYLGAHHPGWLERLELPLMVSRRRLQGYKRLPRARAPWALDSGGFTELGTYGTWQLGAGAYIRFVQRCASDIGLLAFAAPQDWMCEPAMLKKTGLSILEHQRRTVRNYLLLRTLAPDLPWLPVLQGWTSDDYLRCVDLYSAAGVDVAALERVGVGTLCRRQSTREALDILARLAGLRLRLHGFGFKISGLAAARAYLSSADSLAWSYDARRSPPLGGCRHKNCANCPRWAVAWYERVMCLPSRPHQLALVWPEEAAP